MGQNSGQGDTLGGSAPTPLDRQGQAPLPLCPRPFHCLFPWNAATIPGVQQPCCEHEDASAMLTMEPGGGGRLGGPDDPDDSWYPLCTAYAWAGRVNS